MVTQRCSNCGESVSADYDFCPNCGRILRYAGYRVRFKDQIDLMRGVRREGAVLFVGLPKDCVDDPDHYLNLAKKICWMIEEDGGVGEWIEPDYRVLGIFGLPIYTPDFIERALNTALKIRNLGSGFRIAVNTGPFFLAAFGTPHHSTIFGETVNLASKLLDQTGIGEIVVTEAVAQHCRFEYELIPEDGNFRLVRSRDTLFWQIPTLEREVEIEKIKSLFNASMQGKTIWCGIKGRFGIGKSKVKEEIKAIALRYGTVILEVDCNTSGPIQFLKPLAKLVNQILEFANGEIKVQATLFSESLGLKSPHQRTVMVPFANRMPFTDYGDLYGSIVEILNLLARRFTFLVIIEDAHLIDTGTLELLKVIKGRLVNQPVFFLLIYESDLMIKDLKVGDFNEIELKPLSRKAVEQLVKVFYKDKPPELDFYRITGGNPYYTIQVLKNPEFYHLVKDPDYLQRQIIIEKIDRLPPNLKETLFAAAIAGEGFEPKWLLTLINRPVEEELVALIDAGLLKSSDNLFSFTDKTIKEVASEMMSYEDRIDLHNRLGRILESIYHDKIYNYAEVIAHHFSQGGNYEKASYYLKLAADKALSLSQLDRAVELYLKAVDYLDILNPRDNFYRKMRIDIGENLTRILDYLGDYKNLSEMAEESVAIASRWQLKDARLWALVSLAKGLIGIGESDRARSTLEQILRDAPKKGDITASAQALYGYLHFLNQNYGKAMAYFNLSLNSAQSEGLIHHNLINLIVLHKELGNFTKAHEYAEEGLKSNPSLFFQITYHLILGEIYTMLNAYTLAEGELYWSYSEARRINAIRFEVEAGINRLLAQRISGSIDYDLSESIGKILPLIKGRRAQAVLRVKYLLADPLKNLKEIEKLIPVLRDLAENPLILQTYLSLAQFDRENLKHWATKAFELAERLQLPFYLARAYFWLGESLPENDPKRRQYHNRCKALLDGLVSGPDRFGELIRTIPEYRGATKR